MGKKIPTFKKNSERIDKLALILGRVGFVARSFVWACVGGVAISAAFTGKEAKGTQGALEVVCNNLGGTVILIIATLGIFCYSFWRFFEGFYGLKILETDTKFQQVVNGYITPLFSGIAYIIFAISNIVTIRDGIGNIDNRTPFTEKMTEYTIGKVALALGGILLFCAAIMWIVDLIKQKWKKENYEEQVNQNNIVAIGFKSSLYLGTFGRAITFVILAVELLRVAFDDHIASGGFGAALNQLQINSAGRILLVFAGVLLVVFATFSLFQAKFKKFLPYSPHFQSKNQNQSEMKKN